MKIIIQLLYKGLSMTHRMFSWNQYYYLLQFYSFLQTKCVILIFLGIDIIDRDRWYQCINKIKKYPIIMLSSLNVCSVLYCTCVKWTEVTTYLTFFVLEIKVQTLRINCYVYLSFMTVELIYQCLTPKDVTMLHYILIRK